MCQAVRKYETADLCVSASIKCALGWLLSMCIKLCPPPPEIFVTAPALLDRTEEQIDGERHNAGLGVSPPSFDGGSQAVLGFTFETHLTLEVVHKHAGNWKSQFRDSLSGSLHTRRRIEAQKQLPESNSDLFGFFTMDAQR